MFAHSTDPKQDRPVEATRLWVVDLIVLAVVIGGFFLAFLGARPLGVPSEARYAELGREIAMSGDWVTPRINGVKYFFKPPLFYWIQAASIHAFGMSEFALRLATALFALGGCLLAYVGGRAFFGRPVGLLAAAMLATMLIWFALARIVLLDIPVGVFLSLSLLAFLLAVRGAPAERPHAGWLYTMYAAAAAATMTKGLIGIVLPALVIGLWIVLTWNWRLLREVRLVSGLGVFLALTVPWHVAVGVQSPEFWHFYFVREHLERFTSTVHGRYEPWWFFLVILVVGSFPWLGFLGQALARNLKACAVAGPERTSELFLALWFWAILLFFSISDSKLIPYVTPLMVPLAIMLARYVSPALAQTSPPMGLSIGLWAIAGVAALVAIAALAVGVAGPLLASGDLAEDLASARPYMGWLCAGAAFAAAAIGAALWQGRRQVALGLAMVSAATLFLGVDTTMADHQPRSIKPIASVLNQIAKPEDEIAAYRTYPQDLPVYTGRRITVMGWSGELDFGRDAEPATKDWMFDDESELWRRWNSERTVYLVVPLMFEGNVRAAAGERYAELARSRRHLLVVNRAP